MSEKVKQHPFVRAILAKMVGKEGGPVLELADLAAAASTIPSQPRAQRDEVGVQLLVLIKHFEKERCSTTVDQLSYLFVACLGEATAAKMMAATDVPAGQAKKILDAAKKASLGDKIAPPKGAGASLHIGPKRRLPAI